MTATTDTIERAVYAHEPMGGEWRMDDLPGWGAVCRCGWRTSGNDTYAGAGNAHRAHVAAEIEKALGRTAAPEGFVAATCARRGEPVLVKASDPENFGMVLCDPCAFEIALADCYVKHGAGRPMSVRSRLAADEWLRRQRERREAEAE